MTERDSGKHSHICEWGNEGSKLRGALSSWRFPYLAGAQSVDLFVDAICKCLFMEVEMEYGHLSSELMSNSLPSVKGIPGGRIGIFLRKQF